MVYHSFYILFSFLEVMVERSELENRARRLISGDITYRVLKSLGDKGIRRLDKMAGEIVGLLESEEPNNRFFSKVEKTSEQKARTLRQGKNSEDLNKLNIFKENGDTRN